MDEIQQVIDGWREAYRKANEKEPPEVTYEKGWFTIHYNFIHSTKHRKKDMILFTNTLLRRTQAKLSL